MVLSLLKQKRGGCVPMWLVLIRRQQHQGHLGPIASRSHLPHAQLVGIDQACERVACKGGNAQNFMHQRVSASPQHRQRRHLDNDVLIRPDGRCSPAPESRAKAAKQMAAHGFHRVGIAADSSAGRVTQALSWER